MLQLGSFCPPTDFPSMHRGSNPIGQWLREHKIVVRYDYGHSQYQRWGTDPWDRLSGTYE